MVGSACLVRLRVSTWPPGVVVGGQQVVRLAHDGVDRYRVDNGADDRVDSIREYQVLAEFDPRRSCRRLGVTNKRSVVTLKY